jgi:hypothetical protein
MHTHSRVSFFDRNDAASSQFFLGLLIFQFVFVKELYQLFLIRLKHHFRGEFPCPKLLNYIEQIDFLREFASALVKKFIF